MTDGNQCSNTAYLKRMSTDNTITKKIKHKGVIESYVSNAGGTFRATSLNVSNTIPAFLFLRFISYIQLLNVSPLNR